MLTNATIKNMCYNEQAIVARVSDSNVKNILAAVIHTTYVYVDNMVDGKSYVSKDGKFILSSSNYQAGASTPGDCLTISRNRRMETHDCALLL